MIGYHWLASYPKSGNTWLRMALSCLQRDGAPPDFSAEDRFAPIASDRPPFDLLLDVDSENLTDDEAERLRPRFYEVEARWTAVPQIRKVHDAWTLTSAGDPLFPPSVTLGTVCIVRDPRDVAASLINHMGTDADRVIAFMNAPGAAFGGGMHRGDTQFRQRLLTWSAHVRSWLAAPGPLLLRYEDMLADPSGSLLRVTRHLGWSVTPDAAERATAATRFETLRAAEERHGFRERPTTASRFFRRGAAGGWRDTLTPAQSARIEAEHGTVMAMLGYR